MPLWRNIFLIQVLCLCLYTFGKGGYVKRFHEEEPKDFWYDEYPNRSYKLFEKSDDRVLAWRISLNRTSDLLQNRVVYRVEHCRDSDGPKMAPDVFDGSWQPNIPREYLAVEYNQRLAVANSARIDGRHYATGVITVVCRTRAGSSIQRLNTLSTSWWTYLTLVSRGIGNRSSW